LATSRCSASQGPKSFNWRRCMHQRVNLADPGQHAAGKGGSPQ
jgi:hypothetical protein